MIGCLSLAQDVTNRLDLTPVAIMEGMCFAMTVFGDKPTPCIHENVRIHEISPAPVSRLRPTARIPAICAHAAVSVAPMHSQQPHSAAVQSGLPQTCIGLFNARPSPVPAAHSSSPQSSMPFLYLSKDLSPHGPMCAS